MFSAAGFDIIEEKGAMMQMKVIRITPRGYCYGVVDAMLLAQTAAADETLPRPIYILGMIVHNQHVTDAFSKQGIHTLDGENREALLDQIEAGTVIFTAHGVSPAVREKARAKGLTVIDATCPDVNKTHELIREKVALGYDVAYIGKKGHPEPEGAIGVAPGHVHLVENQEDVAKLDLTAKSLLVTNQTTMSQWDTQALMQLILDKYPQAEIHNEICMATQVRQEAVAGQAGAAELLIVVGDPRSNNSNRLAQVSQEIAGVPSRRISDLSELDPDWLQGLQTVAVTSGASTPTPLTKEVVDWLERYEEKNPDTWEKSRSVNWDKLLPTLPKNRS